jgi:hypothetical protein
MTKLSVVKLPSVSKENMHKLLDELRVMVDDGTIVHIVGAGLDNEDQPTFFQGTASEVSAIRLLGAVTGLQSAILEGDL